MVAALILAAALAAAGPALAGTRFFAYDGRDAVRQGDGGDKKVVDGVEFWVDGAPPHRFQILGSLEDQRLKGGILGAISMSGLEHDIAKRARAAGGDAVILSDQHDHVLAMVGASLGGFSFGGGGGFGSSADLETPIAKHMSLYRVVISLPDERAAASPAPAASGAGAQPPFIFAPPAGPARSP
jgi:hypothetical protein